MSHTFMLFNTFYSGWTSISGIESDNEGGLSYKELPAERAEKLLKRMKDAHLDVHPVAQTFNIILDCVSYHILVLALL